MVGCAVQSCIRTTSDKGSGSPSFRKIQSPSTGIGPLVMVLWYAPSDLHLVGFFSAEGVGVRPAWRGMGHPREGCGHGQGLAHGHMRGLGLGALGLVGVD